MKKIGIITLYYKNNNYGGVAQAYALNRYFEKLGYDSELISYDKKKSNLNLVDKVNNPKTFINKCQNKIKKILVKPIEKYHDKKYRKELQKREQLLEEFRNSIKHSKVYNKDNIGEIADKYDYYVTGSDQSWNPGVIDEAFIFGFLKNANKNIFSYASSVAVTDVTDRYIQFMREELKKYNNISIREEQSKEILEKATDKKVEWVIDPTLLLKREEWEEITSKRVINEKYVFSYMLGNSKKQRKIIQKFAKERGLKLVTIPYIKNGNKFEFKIDDYKFGDIQMLDISFGEFLSLVKHAEYVLTDSFHAVCFSYLFKKEFYVFERNSTHSMSSRIYSLMKMFGVTDRIIKNKIIEKSTKIDYDKVDKNICPYIEKSIKYIEKSLNREKEL